MDTVEEIDCTADMDNTKEMKEVLVDFCHQLEEEGSGKLLEETGLEVEDVVDTIRDYSKFDEFFPWPPKLVEYAEAYCGSFGNLVPEEDRYLREFVPFKKHTLIYEKEKGRSVSTPDLVVC